MKNDHFLHFLFVNFFNELQSCKTFEHLSFEVLEKYAKYGKDRCVG